MRIRIIDAFTDRPFSGNPAAVCLLDDADAWPDEAWMQQVAAEMHLSDTAFAHPLSDGGEADWALRWFTPEVETNLCGHATPATAHGMHRGRAHPAHPPGPQPLRQHWTGLTLTITAAVTAAAVGIP